MSIFQDELWWRDSTVCRLIRIARTAVRLADSWESPAAVLGIVLLTTAPDDGEVAVLKANPGVAGYIKTQGASKTAYILHNDIFCRKTLHAAL